jgi:hypothetical protein
MGAGGGDRLWQSRLSQHLFSRPQLVCWRVARGPPTWGVPGPGVQAAECGPCRCHVTYAYHPQLETTYGVGFDPRNFDTTEPHFYYGPVRAWPHYWCENAVYVGKGKAPPPVEAPPPVVTK